MRDLTKISEHIYVYKHYDTDQLIDLCTCKERARFVIKTTLTKFKLGKPYSVQCDSCGNATKWFPTKNETVWEWNKLIRLSV